MVGFGAKERGKKGLGLIIEAVVLLFFKAVFKNSESPVYYIALNILPLAEPTPANRLNEPPENCG